MSSKKGVKIRLMIFMTLLILFASPIGLWAGGELESSEVDAEPPASAELERYSFYVETEYGSERLTERGWILAVAYKDINGWQNRRFTLPTNGESIRIDDMINEYVYWLIYQKEGEKVRWSHGYRDDFGSLSSDELAAIILDRESPRRFVPGYIVDGVIKVDGSIMVRE